MDGVHSRTLERALKLVGSKDRLASAIRISPDELEIYLAGKKPLPNDALILALDIVAGAPGR
jgi:hypothetical protein